MFTGIVRQVGTVRRVGRAEAASRLTIEMGAMARDVALGDSVCVDGCCLTAVSVEPPLASFDVSAETLRLTTLGALREGARVNLEPALRVNDRLGGHFVSGHVDGTGTIRGVERLPGEVRLEVDVPPNLTDMMIMKGSVAVDGVSLTIAALRQNAFEVSLIPHTLGATTLQHKGSGERVNIECDMIGRWVKRLLGDAGAGGARPGLSMHDLEDQGF